MFGIPGQVGQIAEESVAKIIARQQMEREMARREQEAAAQQALQQQRLNQDALQHADTLSMQRAQLDEGAANRRARANTEGLEVMGADRARMDTDEALAQLPPHLKPIAGLMRIGAAGKIGPEDLQTPEQRARTAEAARKAGLADYEEREKIQARHRAPTRAPTPNRIWVMRNGQEAFIPEDQVREGDTRPTSGAALKPSNGLQKRAFGFFNRARQADTDLETVEGEIAKMGYGGQVRQALAPNILQSSTGQRYTQSQRAFTEARLRKDSGAAIPEHEFANDRRTYFVQPGDTPETLQQKRRARAALIASIGFEAGPALAEYEGSEENAAAVLNEYRTRASRAPRVRVPLGQLGQQ